MRRKTVMLALPVAALFCLIGGAALAWPPTASTVRLGCGHHYGRGCHSPSSSPSPPPTSTPGPSPTSTPSPSPTSTSTGTSRYKLPPVKQSDGMPDQWYWEIGPNQPGLAGLPATSAAYPAPGSANIWDTDLFQDSNVAHAGVPTGPSPVVEAIHAAGHYAVCYVEAGAYQIGFPDDSNFAPADYGATGSSTDPVVNDQYQMQGFAHEYWFNLAGFASYVAGEPSTLTGVAPNIASGLNQRFADCKLEGQDAVEPDDLDGYTNKSATGVAGGGWNMTQADSAGFERWLAYDIHANGLAAFQKNDPANAAADEPLFDGMIIEECNYYDDPCSGPGGDATPYLNAGKPVLNAEYTRDGETTAKFCPADIAAGISGALFDANLDGGTYEPCQN
jgi:Glycoside-hydrolase family GH114